MGGLRTGLLTSIVLAVISAGWGQTTMPADSVVKPARLAPPQLHKIRWRTFDKKVDYVVLDAKRRPWFLLKDHEGENPQYVCAEAPDAQLLLPGDYQTLGVDAANRFWIAKPEELFFFDLNDFRHVSRGFKGLFGKDPSTGWPMRHFGQVYLDHSSRRVYCHDFTGVHVLDAKRWTFKKWPAEVLGSAGKVDLAAAKFQAVEAPGGLAIFWAAGDRLKGFWTHDGGVWRHYSSKTNRALGDITAVVPMARGFVLVCSASRNAFVTDLSSGASAAVPETAVMVNHLMRLGHKDAKVRDEAKRIVREMAIADSKKVAEAAGFLADAKLKELAMSVIRAARPGGGGKRRDIPPGPGLPLRGARLIIRSPAGDSLLTWIVEGQKKMGVLRANGKIVAAPAKMSLEMTRRPDQSRETGPDGSIIVATRRLWKFNGREFKLLCDEPLAGKTELLGVDRFGRIFMEAEGSDDYVRAMCDPRYKGVEGTGVVGSKPVLTPISPTDPIYRD